MTRQSRDWAAGCESRFGLWRALPTNVPIPEIHYLSLRNPQGQQRSIALLLGSPVSRNESW